MSQWKTAYTLKKGTFLAGVQCEKRMWWEIHDKGCDELRIDLATQNLFDQGNEVDELARTYIPGGIVIRRDGPHFRTSLANSLAAVRDPAVPVIYQAGFVAHDTMVYADILIRDDDGKGFTLVEVKMGTSVTEENIEDVGLQAHILSSAGVDVRRCEVMRLNRECRYPDLSNLFVREDVTDQVTERMPAIELELDHLLATAKGPLPEVSVGPHCSTPRECAFKDRCWPDVPADHISHLYRTGVEKTMRFEREGFSRIQDLPEEMKLGAIAARQRRCLREGDLYVEHDELIAALATLRHPIAHIDFETVMFAIPRWNGCRPYDQIPVQMSAHLIDEAGNSRHSFWLAEGSGDPRPGIAAALIKACDGAATVTAYNAGFEKKCIEGMMEACPELAPALRAIAHRMVDLLPMVRDHVYHREFRGSFSLKSVLPALVPGLTYDDLEIGEGLTASAQLMRMLFKRTEMADGERQKLRRALLAYCERDTEAMIALTARLRALAGELPALPGSAPIQ